MKKRWMIGGIAVLVMLGIGAFVGTKYMHTFSDDVVWATEKPASCSADGMYYYESGRLYFMDSESGKSVIACNRANCRHEDNTCNAFIQSGYAPYLVCYDEYLFVGEFG